MVPAGSRDRSDGAETRAHICKRATPSSTAAIRISKTMCAARMNCKGKGIHYIDVGTSGGVWGLERGYCMMIGGPKEAVQRLDPIFKTLAPGIGDIPRTPGREKLGGTRGERLHSLRPIRLWTLCEDGAQRH